LIKPLRKLQNPDLKCQKSKGNFYYTGCGHFENPTNFKILKEPILVRIEVNNTSEENPPRACKKSTKNAFRAKWESHTHETATPLSLAEIKSFLLM
jgi:hypothetical protein